MSKCLYLKLLGDFSFHDSYPSAATLLRLLFPSQLIYLHCTVSTDDIISFLRVAVINLFILTTDHMTTCV